MIPTRAKNVLLLPLTDGGITQPFNMPGHPGYDKSKSTHNGLDIGWTTGHAYWPILACQDGKVVGITNNGSSIGNAVVLQHDYEDGTHRWTAYIHLKNNPTVKVGQEIKQGQQIGVRGGSPYGVYVTEGGVRKWQWKQSSTSNPRYGVHLHLYVTKAVKDKYTWNTMKSNVIDPLPLLYRSKNIKYDKLVGQLATLPILEDACPEVVDPVERNESVDQLLEKSNKLRVRMEPSLSGTIIGYLKPDVYYNWYEIAEADGYTWYKIADKQWAAKTSTMVIYPKKLTYDELQGAVAELRAEIDKLLTNIDSLGKENANLSKENSSLINTVKEKEDENAELKKQNTSLDDNVKLLNSNIEKLSTKITEAVTVLTLEDK